MKRLLLIIIFVLVASVANAADKIIVYQQSHPFNDMIQQYQDRQDQMYKESAMQSRAINDYLHNQLGHPAPKRLPYQEPIRLNLGRALERSPVVVERNIWTGLNSD